MIFVFFGFGFLCGGGGGLLLARLCARRKRNERQIFHFRRKKPDFQGPDYTAPPGSFSAQDGS